MFGIWRDNEGCWKTNTCMLGDSTVKYILVFPDLADAEHYRNTVLIKEHYSVKPFIDPVR